MFFPRIICQEVELRVKEFQRMYGRSQTAVSIMARRKGEDHLILISFRPTTLSVVSIPLLDTERANLKTPTPKIVRVPELVTGIQIGSPSST